jgi:two-component sensor histidine kinase
MHELATNAAKYGALSTENGVVDITWEIDGEQLKLTWTESGGPPVTPPTRKGFGRLLIERVLASDLDGTVTLDFAGEGLKCVITLPMRMHLPASEALSLIMPVR